MAQHGLAAITPVMSDLENAEARQLAAEYRARVTASARQ
jgi:hypothetical protein